MVRYYAKYNNPTPPPGPADIPELLAQLADLMGQPALAGMIRREGPLCIGMEGVHFYLDDPVVMENVRRHKEQREQERQERAKLRAMEQAKARQKRLAEAQNAKAQKKKKTTG